jgi:hypothetical protein
MSEKCPKCKSYTLSHDKPRSTARCMRFNCDFEERVNDRNDYFDRFVLTELNWDGYCGSTPDYVREIRGHLAPPNKSCLICRKHTGTNLGFCDEHLNYYNKILNFNKSELIELILKVLLKLKVDIKDLMDDKEKN